MDKPPVDGDQIPGPSQLLTRLQQEKAEAAALLQDPPNTVIDHDQESLDRMQTLRQQQQQDAPAAAEANSGQQQQEQDADEEQPTHNGSRPAAAAAAAGADGGSRGKDPGAEAAAVAAAAAGGSSGDDENGGATAAAAGGVGDPYAGMNARQRKLFELKQKMQQARKANENAIIAERKRMRADTSEKETNEGSKRRWYEEKKKKQEEQLAKMGLTAAEAHRLESAEVAEAKYKKKEKKQPAAFGWDAFNQTAIFNAYDRRAAKIKPDLEAYRAAKEAQPDRAVEVDPLQHGKQQEVAPEGVDAMVAELTQKQAQRAAFSRRRAFRTDADVDYINSRNAHFNKKIERAFGKHTAEIKANLERGTALPD